ncbi:hypothetical protein [Filimonas effusa]|uniref:PorT family protein n=1 Tax=Filimonas effusa TaxID=2508721 RepID=A0A4Q1D4E2_9BACT|nr:hypothetical protein [Filimonas effusa]RXK83332.1 hypothetical protein ESB13_14610 [Filimonas effusa]
MKKSRLLVTLLLFSGSSFAQNISPKVMQHMKDSIILSQLRAAALKYPILRQGSVSTEVISRTKISSQLYGEDLYEGEAQITRVRANFNLPIYRKGKHLFSTTLNYLGQQFDLNNANSLNPRFPAVQNTEVYKTTLNLIASYSRSDSIFHRPVNFSASVSVLTDGEFSNARLNYLGVINFPLRRTATTAYSVGLIVNIDPSSPVPVFPIFNYWHQFKRPEIELFIDLPSRIALRKPLRGKTAVLLGSELGGSLSFLNMNNSYLPKRTIYTTLEIKSGATFEYSFSKYLMLGVNGGILSTVSSRHLEKSAKMNDYFIKNSIHSAPYVNVSLSLLPAFLHL